MDKVIATSAKSASYLEVDAQVIRHGVNCELFQPVADRAALRAELDLPTDGLLVGCFGRIRPQKGNDLFIKAMIKACQANPDARALMMGRAVGEHEAFLQDLKDEVEAAGLSDRILFRDEVDIEDVPRHFQALDLYVAPQRWEGFGLTPLEAMACGAPSVSTRVGAFEELIVPGETGTLCDIEDLDKITADIIDCLSDKDRLQQMSKASRQHVETNFRLEGEAAAIIAVYQDLLNRLTSKKRPADCTGRALSVSYFWSALAGSRQARRQSPYPKRSHPAAGIRFSTTSAHQLQPAGIASSLKLYFGWCTAAVSPLPTKM